jgi:hypothetical protein
MFSIWFKIFFYLLKAFIHQCFIELVFYLKIFRINDQLRCFQKKTMIKIILTQGSSKKINFCRKDLKSLKPQNSSLLQ